MSLALAKPDCPLCAGTGWIRVEDGGAGAARPCSCGAELRAPRLLAAAEIPPRYGECSLENFRIGLPSDRKGALQKALSQCRGYVDSFLSLEAGGFTEKGLLLMGPPGVGKTHLAVAVLSALIRSYGVRGRFIDFTSFISRIQATFDPSSEESKHDVLDPVLNAEVLVLDELGAQKPTPFVRDTLYLVLNTRYNQRRATIFTTNFRFSAKDVKEPAGPRLETREALPFDLSKEGASRHDLLVDRLTPMLVSRLHEMGKLIEIDTADFRKLPSSQRSA